jgi:hypothetical protein
VQIKGKSHLTLLAQYWQLGPCQPSRHRQLPLTQFPLRQLSRSQVEALDPAKLVEELAAAVSKGAAHCSNVVQRRRLQSRDEPAANFRLRPGLPASSSVSSSPLPSAGPRRSPRAAGAFAAFRRYLDLYRNKNICAASAILVGFHVNVQRQWPTARSSCPSAAPAPVPSSRRPLLRHLLKGRELSVRRRGSAQPTLRSRTSALPRRGPGRRGASSTAAPPSSMPPARAHRWPGSASLVSQSRVAGRGSRRSCPSARVPAVRGRANGQRARRGRARLARITWPYCPEAGARAIIYTCGPNTAILRSWPSACLRASTFPEYCGGPLTRPSMCARLPPSRPSPLPSCLEDAPVCVRRGPELPGHGITSCGQMGRSRRSPGLPVSPPRRHRPSAAAALRTRCSPGHPTWQPTCSSASALRAASTPVKITKNYRRECPRNILLLATRSDVGRCAQAQVLHSFRSARRPLARWSPTQPRNMNAKLKRDKPTAPTWAVLSVNFAHLPNDGRSFSN